MNLFTQAYRNEKKMKTSVTLHKWITPFLLLSLIASVNGGLQKSFAGDISCIPDALENLLKIDHPATLTTVAELAKFAKEHNLPTKVVKMGPADRPIERLFVGIDWTNEALVDAYLQKFNLDAPLGGDVAGSLVLEFQQEGTSYTTGVLRPGAGKDDPIYRWGKIDLKRSNWWTQWVLTRAPQDSAIKGYAHVIGVSESERANIRTFLEKPGDRGPCKSSNCVAWTSSIELGETKIGNTDAQRKYLFNELGMARSSAHFEIGRRLLHAANQRHSAVFVFYTGEAGLEAFNQLEKKFPPAPQIPYDSIIHGLGLPKDSPVMQAISTIPDGAKIFVPIAAGASPDAVQAIMQSAPKMQRGWDLHMLVNGVSEGVLRKGVETSGNRLRLHALFLGGNLRKLYQEGRVGVIPGYLGDFTKWVRDETKSQFHYDVIIVRVAPKDAQGRYSLGPNNDMIMTIIRNRPGIRVIAEVNEHVPRTKGANFLTEDQITTQFKSDAALAGPPRVPLTSVETKIGNHLAELIPDEATLQIGIGNIFDGLPAGLKTHGRKGLKIFTEMFGDPLMGIMKDKIAVEAQTGFAYGSKDLYSWLNNNRKVEFVETEYVNNPGRVSQKKKFHAVNTALQVSLRGDVNATFGPDGRMSSPGGQVEFMSGAARSPGGKAIIAIRSTAKDGAFSTIVLNLYEGPVTTPNESVTHVVTEFGTALIAGQSEQQRAFNLINVAHPKFRTELIQQALARKMISETQAENLEQYRLKAQNLLDAELAAAPAGAH